MVSRPREEILTALRAASQNADVTAVTSMWRELSPLEQEEVLFTLLGMEPAVTSETAAAERDGPPEVATPRMDETAALEPVEQTVLTPKLVEDLRGLSGSENDRPSTFRESAAVPDDPTGYRFRWRRRWKWSMLVAAWAVTTTFAFTANVSTFGPMEWFVAIFASVVGGGLLFGTLLNFAVAAIPTHARAPQSPR